MTENYSFNAEIKPVEEFQVGDKENSFMLSIKYNGEEAVQLRDCTFRLLAGIGKGETALVQSVPMAEYIEVVSESSGIEIDRYSLPDNDEQYVWEITPAPYDDGHFSSITITFKKIKSQTEAGMAKFAFESQIDGEELPTKTLELKKQSDIAGIIYFYSTTEERQKSRATPESIFPADEQIFQGEKVILKWRINNLDSLSLKKGGSTVQGVDFEKNEKAIYDINDDTDFVLSGTDPVTSEKKASRINIKVLRKGWHDSTKTVDGVQLEPVHLFNANNQTIYAIFLRKSNGDKEEGLLFQTGNPFWGWTSIKSSVPEGFITSPGVYHHDKLWLVGGSQIDPDNTSNGVWCFDPQKGGWEDYGDAEWSERMGHAVLEFDKKIWVLGGCDAGGNALNDIWTFDVSSKKWTGPLEAQGQWSERCMLSAVEYNGEIWVCGGLEEPTTGEFLKDAYTYDKQENRWHKLLPSNKLRLPIEGSPRAACLQVFNEKLHLIGKTEKESRNVAFHYRLDHPTWFGWTQLKSEDLHDWAVDPALSIQLLNFNNKLLIAKALEYSHSPGQRYSLKLYIP